MVWIYHPELPASVLGPHVRCCFFTKWGRSQLGHWLLEIIRPNRTRLWVARTSGDLREERPVGRLEHHDVPVYRVVQVQVWYRDGDKKSWRWRNTVRDVGEGRELGGHNAFKPGHLVSPGSGACRLLKSPLRNLANWKDSIYSLRWDDPQAWPSSRQYLDCGQILVSQNFLGFFTPTVIPTAQNRELFV